MRGCSSRYGRSSRCLHTWLPVVITSTPAPEDLGVLGLDAHPRRCVLAVRHHGVGLVSAGAARQPLDQQVAPRLAHHVAEERTINWFLLPSSS